MGKQHNTFPNEQPEAPVPQETPEIKPLADPKEPEVPKEDPQVVPEEFPPEDNPEVEPPGNPDL